MKISVTVDDQLWNAAMSLVDPTADAGELIDQALRMLVRIRAGMQLATLGGTMPDMAEVPRFRDAIAK
ncbi:type II toxin-antitoxin system VapB family antitoxin [Pseudoduganella sp. FT93W]|uniref:Type II toxin-antitoxin system VapB family antitoxin n=1 Tax=Duganella fentianensis TaxID=2692177 RepID=A0A845I0X6_9BURK|nr:type II toxin-antitoxin system VapB family antitoxin [Duganella fentianensis]MYN47150.1 type II toxin-antitoxin system VapB family antitoxin [Duganella fentianensis]